MGEDLGSMPSNKKKVCVCARGESSFFNSKRRSSEASKHPLGWVVGQMRELGIKSLQKR
jgi:hypothetical protein